jgi:molybdopterin-guanine dinucleotide biosynthesis protein A
MNLTAVLFAGGESRRMGADKATLIYEGEPLWSRQLQMLKELSPKKNFVSARIKPPWCPPEIETVLDAPPSRGPLGGLAAALGKIRTPHLLALAVDMPLMTAEHLRWLQSQVRPGCGVMPVWCGDSEPLCAIYPVEAREWAGVAMSGDDVALKSLAATLRGKKLMRDCHLTEDMMAHYQNFNSPADFSKSDFFSHQPLP